jgi:hypothetical protein
MGLEIIDEAGNILQSFEDIEKAKEFVDESESDLAVFDTEEENIVYP